MRRRVPGSLAPVLVRRCGRGFTLLEILVVVVIIAVMTTIGVLSMGTLGGDRELDAELERYTDAAAAGIEQAQLEGRDYGMHFTPNGYQVYVYAAERQRWEGVAGDRLYERHEFPSGVQPRLEIEGKPVLLGRERADAPQLPQVVLYASGDVSPYRLSLAREGTDGIAVIEGRPDGTLGVTRPKEAR